MIGARYTEHRFVAAAAPTLALAKSGVCKPQGIHSVLRLPALAVDDFTKILCRAFAAVKIHCEFLAADRWQVEGKRRIGVHDGCGVAAVTRGGSSGQRLPM